MGQVKINSFWLFKEVYGSNNNCTARSTKAAPKMCS